MPRFVIFYIAFTILQKIWRFFLHWYANGSRAFWLTVLEFLEELEKAISLRITVYNWHKPLYNDYSALGYAIGVPIRTLRIVLSAALYALLLVFFAMLYLVWLATPIFLVSRLL